jgi:hypothetical protein
VGDLRDQRTWVAIELARAGEIKAIEGTLDRSFRQDLGLDSEHPIFIPVALYHRDGRTTPIHLMEGYAFIGSGLEDVAYYALEQHAYVNQVMSTRQGRHRFRYLSVITHAQIEAMQRKLREMVTADIPIRATVAILDGPYRGLKGQIVGLDANNGFVRITLRSLDVVATIPRVFLEESVGE